MLPPREFRFKDCEDDAKLTLAFSRSIDGWTIARECLNKEVCSFMNISKLKGLVG